MNCTHTELLEVNVTCNVLPLFDDIDTSQISNDVQHGIFCCGTVTFGECS